jgi:hypothetical protein
MRVGATIQIASQYSSMPKCLTPFGTLPHTQAMTRADILRTELSAVEADAHFTEAVMCFRDESRLCFCHRVGERWAKAIGPAHDEQAGGLAGELLAAMTLFRLNAKHLDIQFDDGSRWDEALQNLELSDG